jgi:hypothetical protein
MGLDGHLLWLLRGVRMLSAAINFQLGEEAATEPILRQHPAHRGLDQALRLISEHLARGSRADAARIGRVAMVQLILGLRAGKLDLRRIDDDNEIAGVLMGREVRSMLAAQDASRTRRNPAQGAPIGVDQNPAPATQRIFMRDADSLFGQLQDRSPHSSSREDRSRLSKFGGADGI